LGKSYRWSHHSSNFILSVRNCILNFIGSNENPDSSADFKNSKVPKDY
jgi:hypothetical protein